MIKRKQPKPPIKKKDYPACPRCGTNKYVVYMELNFICLKPKDDEWGGKKANGNKCWYHINDHKLYKKKKTCKLCGSDDLYPARRICKACKAKEVDRGWKRTKRKLKAQKTLRKCG